jgi:AcrR family transcriptional regulator
MDKPTERHLRSWQRRKQARPGEILEAALAVFAEKGFAAARMEDIAVRAGVTKGTIYLYFPSKEEVFKSLAREHVGQSLILATEMAEKYEGSAFDFLKFFYARFFELCSRATWRCCPRSSSAKAATFRSWPVSGARK